MKNKLIDFCFKHKEKLHIVVLVVLIGLLFHRFFQAPYNGLYLYYDDATNQVLRFYQGMWETIRQDGILKLWDWSNFMGANYIASNSYYNLFSPFTAIFYLFDKELIPYLLLWTNMLKLVLIGLVGYQICKSYTTKTYIRIIGMLILTFNGWVFAYAKYLFMWDGYLFMLLIILGIELYMSRRKTWVLVVSTAMLGIVNFYFLYMFSFIVVLYFVFRFIYINGFNFSKWKEVAFFALYYSLGIAMSMIIFLPSILNIMGTPRISGESQDVIASFSQLFRYFTGYFAPPQIYGSFNGFLDARFGAAGWNGGMSFYSLLITPLLLPQLLLKNKSNYKLLLGYIALTFLVCIIPIYYLFQGSLESRWFIVFVIINCFMVCKVLEQGLNRKVLIASLGLVALVPAVIYWIVARTSIQDLNVLKQTVEMVYKIVALYAVGVVLIILKREAIVPCVLVFEILMINPLINEDLSVKSVAYANGKYDHYEAIESIKDSDDSIYRIDIMTKQLIENYPMLNIVSAYNLSGFSGYHSIYNYNLSEFAQSRFSQKSEWYFYNQPYKMDLKNQLGNKYWISNINDEALFINPPVGYEKTMSFDDGYEVYENKYLLPLMQFSSYDIPLDEYLQNSILMQDMIRRDNVVVENAKYEYKKPDYLLKKEPMFKDTNNYLDTKQGDIIYIEHQGDKSSTKTYSLFNENELVFKLQSTFDFGYIDIPVPLQSYSLVVEGDIGMFDVYVETNYENYIKNKSQEQNEMITSSLISNDELSFQINAPKDGYVHFAIPYDAGWHVYIDDVEMKMLNVNNGFIGSIISKGEHEVTIKYRTPGLLAGTIVSGFALSFYIVIIVVRRKYDKFN